MAVETAAVETAAVETAAVETVAAETLAVETSAVKTVAVKTVADVVDTTPKLKEPPVSYDEAEILDWSGDVQLEAIVADFDDKVAESDEKLDKESNNMMYLITKELIEQLRSETTKSKKRSEKPRKRWLVEFLSTHGFWLRRETFPVWSLHFDWDIRLWYSELEGGLACRPCCPRC